ncbi:MAG: hypothetical protein IJ439_01620 [Tyzzerella sp.]|nr:hypothetical protein [Tyzzerella sp.]
MHVSAKKIAVTGLLAAFSAVVLVLSSVVESSSLFFIAAASFCVGIVIREWGAGFGFGFLIASTFVNVIVSPNKFYCMTYAAMGLYLLLSEFLWEKIAAKECMKNRTLTLWIGKYLIFNVIYVPVLLFFQELIFTKKITGVLWIIVLLGGQAALLIYDRAYVYFQGMVWGKLRVRLLES